MTLAEDSPYRNIYTAVGRYAENHRVGHAVEYQVQRTMRCARVLRRRYRPSNRPQQHTSAGKSWMHMFSGRACAVSHTDQSRKDVTQRKLQLQQTVASASLSSTRREKGMPASGGLPRMSEAQAIPFAVCLLFHCTFGTKAPATCTQNL